MLTLKITYKGKNFILPKGLDSLNKIQQELSVRFPGEFAHGALISYQGTRIQEFKQIEDISKQSGAKSIKLEAQPAPAKIEPVIEQAPQVEVSKQIKKQIPAQIKQPAPQIQIKQEKPSEPAHQENKPEEKPSIQEPLKNTQHEPIKQNQKNVEQKQQEENRKEQDEGVFQHNIQIDSMSSNEDIEIDEETKEEVEKVEEPVEKTEEKVEDKKQEVELQKEHKPEIIKCAMFGDKVQPINVEEVKCKITNYSEIEVPKTQSVLEKKEVSSQIPVYVSEIKEQQPLSLVQIQKGVYKCMFCYAFQDCKICDSRRKLTQNSKIILLINHIVDRKVQEKMQKFIKEIDERFQKLKIQTQNKKIQPIRYEPKHKIQVVQISKSEEQKKLLELIQKQEEQLRTSFIEIDDDQGNKKQVMIGDGIVWKFLIKLKKELKYRHKICLIQERSGEIINVGLSGNLTVQVGEYKATVQGKFERTYRLCLYKVNDEMQMFGPKFGFSVMVGGKDKPKKVLKNTMRQQLQQIKKAYKVDKSTEYLIEKMREMGITEENFEQMKDMLPDIFAAI